MTQPEFICQLEYLGLSHCNEKKLQRGINKSFRKSLKAQPKPTVVAVYDDWFTFKRKKAYLRFHDIRKICGSEFHKTVVACTSIDDNVKIITMRFARDKDYRRIVAKFTALVKKNIEPILSRFDTTEVQSNEVQSISLSPITVSSDVVSPTVEPIQRSTIYEIYNRAAVETSRRQSRSEAVLLNPLSNSLITTPPQPLIIMEDTPRQAACSTAMTPPQPPVSAVVIHKQTSSSTSTASSLATDSAEVVQRRASQSVRQIPISPSRSTKSTQKQNSGYPAATQTRISRSKQPTPMPLSRHAVATQKQTSGYPAATQTHKSLSKKPSPIPSTCYAVATQKQTSGYPAATQTRKSRTKQPSPIPLSRYAVAKSEQSSTSIRSTSGHSSPSITPMHSINPILTSSRRPSHSPVLTPRWRHLSGAQVRTQPRSSTQPPHTPSMSTRRTSVCYIHTRSPSGEGSDADLITSFVTSEDHRQRKCVKDMPSPSDKPPMVFKTAYKEKDRSISASVSVKPKPKRCQPRKHVTKNKEGIYRYLSQYDSDTDASSASDTSEDRPSPLFPAAPNQKKESRVCKNTAPDLSKPFSPTLVQPPNTPSNCGQENAVVVEAPTS